MVNRSFFVVSSVVFFVSLLSVGCEDGESITDPGGADPGSEDPPNEQVEELDSQEGASWTLLEVDVGTENEESTSVQAVVDGELEVDATISPEGTLFFLIPDLDAGDYVVRVTEGEETWEFDLTVQESGESPDEEAADEIVDELDSAGSESGDAEAVLTEIESLEAEEQSKAEAFLSRNRALVEELMDAMGGSQMSSLSLSQKQNSVPANVNVDVIVQAVTVLDAATETMSKIASLRESVDTSPGVELGLEFVDRVVDSLLPVVNQMASTSLQMPIIFQGEGIRLDTSAGTPALSLTWESSEESAESWDATTGESHQMQVEPLVFRTVQESDSDHESPMARSLAQSYEEFRTDAEALYERTFDAYSEETEQKWPQLEDQLSFSMETEDLSLDIVELEPGLLEVTVLPTDHQMEPEPIETTLHITLELEDQAFEFTVPVNAEIDPETIPDAPEFSAGWTLVDPDLGSDPIHELVDIDFRDAKHGWAVGYDNSSDDGEGVAIYTNDRGHTWERDFETETGENYRPVQVEYLSTGRAIALTRNGTMLSKMDGEAQWSVSDLTQDLPFTRESRFWTLGIQDDERWWLAGALVADGDEESLTPLLIETNDGGGELVGHLGTVRRRDGTVLFGLFC